jgi:hypothetical protein
MRFSLFVFFITAIAVSALRAPVSTDGASTHKATKKASPKKGLQLIPNKAALEAKLRKSLADKEKNLPAAVKPPRKGSAAPASFVSPKGNPKPHPEESLDLVTWMKSTEGSQSISFLGLAHVENISKKDCADECTKLTFGWSVPGARIQLAILAGTDEGGF